MTATKYVADFDYTNAELLALYRQCLARISVSGQEYEIGTRRFTAADLAEVRATINELEQKVSAGTCRGAAESLVSLRRRGI